MGWLVQCLGGALVLLGLADLYLTVLYARSGTSLLSERLAEWSWHGLRLLARTIPRYRHGILSVCGPAVLLLIAGMWICCLVFGFALVIWPALGTGIKSLQGPTPTDFLTAVMISGDNLTTVGSGELVPAAGFYRIVSVLDSLLGISTLTLTLTYFLEVYNALLRRNTVALALHHAAAGKADAAELVAGLGATGNFEGARAELTKFANELLNLYESHHFYPTLLYFRFHGPEYALSRVTLLTMDTVSIIRTALGDRHADIRESGAADQLWGVGIHLLGELSHVFLPGQVQGRDHQPDDQTAAQWRRRFHDALVRLKRAGIETTRDEAAAADEYVSLRGEWNPFVAAFGNYMVYRPDEIDPATPRDDSDAQKAGQK